MAWGSEWAENADIYFNRSTDGGLTWLTTPTRLSFDADGVPTTETGSLKSAAMAIVSVSAGSPGGWLALETGMSPRPLPGIRRPRDDLASDRGSRRCRQGRRHSVAGGRYRVLGVQDLPGLARLPKRPTRPVLPVLAGRRSDLGSARRTARHGCRRCIGFDRGRTQLRGLQRLRRLARPPRLRSGIFFNHSEDGGVTWQAGDTHIETVGQSGANVSSTR